MSGGIARAGVGRGRRAASCVLSEGENELTKASISAIESRRSIGSRSSSESRLRRRLQTHAQSKLEWGENERRDDVGKPCGRTDSVLTPHMHTRHDITWCYTLISPAHMGPNSNRPTPLSRNANGPKLTPTPAPPPKKTTTAARVSRTARRRRAAATGAPCGSASPCRAAAASAAPRGWRAR